MITKTLCYVLMAVVAVVITQMLPDQFVWIGFTVIGMIVCLLVIEHNNKEEQQESR